MSSHKHYLGDGAYSVLDRFGTLVLTTENGLATTNRIVLDHEVLDELERWLAWVRATKPEVAEPEHES